MTGDDRPGSEHLGQLSEAAAADGAAAPRPPATGRRYTVGGELGAGGMGRVRAAYDTLLQREIAIKQVRAVHDESSEAALLREARVTARLDHPSIIAILDAGEDDHGRVFYAMRVVHGHGLDEIVAGQAGRSGRIRLLRSLLQVAQALAYAHGEGIVHRDVSARNVRIGAHGEVAVMDWGLAATVEEARRSPRVCGTPGYRAPELAAGAPAGPSADVWSLGALLHLVVAGHPPGAALPRRGVAAELRSLLARALAPDPGARYADAGELAADLAAYLDGEPLRAHRDRPWDRAARLARRRPGVLGTATASIAAVAVVALVLGDRARDSADHARRAREQARRAQHEARAALREMVVDRSWLELRADRRGAAGALAARARELDDRAGVAGTLAAFALTSPPAIEPLWPEDPCEVVAVRDRGARLCTAAGATFRIRGGRRAALPIAGVMAARFRSGGGLVVVTGSPSRPVAVILDDELRVVSRHELSGGEVTIDEAEGSIVVRAAAAYHVLRDGAARAVAPCAAGIPIRFMAVVPSGAGREPSTVSLCGDGTLARVDAAGSSRRPSFELGARIPASRAAVVFGDHLFVGGSDGLIGLVELASARVVYAARSPVGAVRAVLAAPRDDVVIVGEDGVALWAGLVGAARHVEDADRATGAAVAAGRVIVWGPRGGAEWIAPAERRVHRVTTRGGIAAVAVHPGGRFAAFGDGSGAVSLLDLEAGTVRRRHLAEQVVKSIVFAPDGRTGVAGAASGHGAHVFDVESFAPRPGPWTDPSLFVRRLAYLSPRAFAAFQYSTRLAAYRIDTGEPVAIAELTALPLDTAGARDGSRLAVLGVGGEIWRRDRGAWRPARPAPGAGAIALSGDGRLLAIAAADGSTIELRDAAHDATLRVLDVAGDRIEDLDLDREGARVAVGRASGVVEVLDAVRGRRALVADAHDGRAAAVAFSPDGCRLVSGGWDAVGRVFALCAADLPPAPRR